MKNSKNTIAWIPIVIALSLIGGIWLGLHFSTKVSHTSGQRKLDNILGLIESDYVDEVDIDSIIELTIPKLMANLDPHSTYIPASELQAVNEDLDGSFSGIGVSFTMLTDTVTINEVIPGGPSEKVGIMPGDRVITINDSLVAGQGIVNTDIVKMLRGEKGTTVNLGIKRNNSKNLLTFEVTRGDIPVNTVDAAYLINPTTGYVKVNKFGRTTYSEFFTSLVKLKAAGARNFILDLRGNGGGFMEMAIMMANEFLPANSPIVYTRGRNDDDESRVFSDGTGSFIDSELVVLIDEYSASASEIFAGAMQDNDRALIVGRRSFGKGLVQRQTTLPDSSAIRLTVSRYHTPSGRCIQKDYQLGKRGTYEQEILDRYDHGEFYNSDSIKFNKDLQYTTAGGRTVYGGGGIMPDFFVPNDTAGISSYYINVLNAGLLQRFAFEYSDRYRERLSAAKNVNEILALLPPDDELLQLFVSYAAQNGIPARWYYINISQGLIVNYLKALIASDIIGRQAYYEVANTIDPAFIQAVTHLEQGDAAVPITAQGKVN
ncbi:S41 family peptidase [Muribaculum gordoncarteri]|jgi:carboxyl-terminal processing protease|uniref:S41 family peptidase n=12 Tax=Muribaculum TaxID=1918540 RepID=A0A4P7VQ45_9BACT|nr:S41 family peptidase [Muribaculum gordoncarteri]QCD36129.1 S41 family peptidase [Muribaculum gordoncarteri]